MPRIYCAGPLFNQAERVEMTAIADLASREGFTVYLPHRDGMEFRHIHQELMTLGWDAAAAGATLHRAIFALDVFQLVEACDAVIWNMNGRTPDEGAVSEAAICWALGKPLVAYKDDVRSLIAGRENPLLAGLVGFRILSNLREIPAALRAALAEPSPRPTTDLPERIRLTVEQGRDLWNVLHKHDRPATSWEISQGVVALFANANPVGEPPP